LYCIVFNSISQKNKALRSTSYNQTLSRKEMDIKLNAVDYKIWGIMQDRVYACNVTSVDGTAIMGYYGSGSPYSLGRWTEDDTVKTTINGISNITFIKRTQTRVSN